MTAIFEALKTGEQESEGDFPAPSTNELYTKTETTVDKRPPLGELLLTRLVSSHSDQGSLVPGPFLLHGRWAESGNDRRDGGKQERGH